MENTQIDIIADASTSAISAPKASRKPKAEKPYTWREFRLQLVREDVVELPVLSMPNSAADYLRKLNVFQNPDVESFVVIALNTKGRVLGYQVVFSGTANSCICHPREVFRFAVFAGATGIIVSHNHPSGDPAPSSQDVKVTRQLRESATVLGISLVDHVIVGSVKSDPAGLGYYSFRNSGAL